MVGIFGAVAIGAIAAWYRSSDFRCSIDQQCSQLLAVEGAVRMYRLDTGHLPRNLDDLLGTSIPGRGRPYILKAALVDPEGGPIDYKVDSKSGDFRLAHSPAHSGFVRSCPGSRCYTENDG